MNQKDWIVLTILFMVAFWLWTLPIQKNHLPFGEGDAAWHFSNSDWAAQSDHSFWRLPNYIGYWYYNFNKALGPNALEYPPPWHLNAAMMQIIGGERVIPIFIYYAVSCFLALFSAYFLVRKLYGFLPAVMTATALLFAWRDMLSYVWGQRPGITAYAFIPLVMYALYKYIDSFYNKENKIIYLYIFALLFSATFLLHLQAIVFLVPASLIFIILISIKEKKLPLNKANFAHILASCFIILVICLPFLAIYLGTSETNAERSLNNLGRLFFWLKAPADNFSLNPSFFKYADAYGSVWTLPLLLFGILILLFRRNRNDILMLSALLGLYFTLHLDVFGLAPLTYRIARFLSIEAYFFYAVMAIALISIPSLLKLPDNIKKIANYALVILFIFFIVSTQGAKAQSLLSNAYADLSRITPYQYEASIWIKDNIQPNSVIYDFGTLTYPKMRFMQALSNSYFMWNPEQITRQKVISGLGGKNITVDVNYAVFDYSDMFFLKDQNSVSNLLAIESQLNLTPIYDKNYIRVYKIG